MTKKIIGFVMLACWSVGMSSTLLGHEIYQDVMKEKYTLKSFSCKTCHPDSDDKKIRSLFAELIYQEMKDGNYSEKFAIADAQGKDAVTEFEQMIAEDFKKAIVVVGQKQLTIDQILAAGLLNGARLDDKKIAEMKAAESGQSAPEVED
jgi:ribosomal protein S3AE